MRAYLFQCRALSFDVMQGTAMIMKWKLRVTATSSDCLPTLEHCAVCAHTFRAVCAPYTYTHLLHRQSSMSSLNQRQRLSFQGRRGSIPRALRTMERLARPQKEGSS